MKTNKPLTKRSTPTEELGCISYQSYLDAIKIVKQYHVQVEEECQIKDYSFFLIQMLIEFEQFKETINKE